MWDETNLLAIKDVKTSILKKKIILGLIIDSYARYDKIFRYLHMILALFSPLIVFIDQLVEGNTDRVSNSVLVISAVVAGMIKLKEYLKFDKIKDIAKQQTVKYTQLYQKIEQEVKKSSTVPQQKDFVYWIGREFSQIEMADPDISHEIKNRFVSLCKDKNIPHSEDIDMLIDIATEKIAIAETPEQTEVVEEKTIHTDRQITKQAFKEQISTFDSKEDLHWAIERLKQ